MNQRATGGSWPPVVAVGPLELLAWGLRRRVRMRVVGDSMNPCLHDGDTVLVCPADRATVGDVVVSRHPFKTDVHLIKRVAGVTADGMQLKGDNPDASTDSRSLGTIPWVHLLGVVTGRL